MSKRVNESLRAQMFGAVLLSLTAAAAVFCICFFIGNVLLERTVYGESFADEIEDRQIVRLQEYIEAESISVESLHRVNAWFSREDKMYLTVYHNNILVYESPVFGDAENETEIPEYDPDMEESDNEYALTLQGGVKVRAFLYYYAGYAAYYWMTAFAGIAAFIVFSLCFAMMVNRKVTYIKQLKRELDVLAGGQLEYSVTISGNDELSELAFGIDNMRTSILEHMNLEKEMRTANSELVTAMSHDLRTPLTSLLAYLEMIERRKCSDEKQMYDLIHKCLEQTLRIRHMADKMFEYFLIYEKEWDRFEMEEMDADQLFQHIREDFVFSLESRGLKIRENCLQISGSLKINAGLLKRVFDNLYSNLLKYADAKEPVSFSYRQAFDCVLLIISNHVASNRSGQESTNIGLSTCKRIIEHHEGTFITTEENGHFMVTITLPLI